MHLWGWRDDSVVKSTDLQSLRHHKVAREKRFLRAVLWLPHMCNGMFEPTYKMKEIGVGEKAQPVQELAARLMAGV